MLWVGLWGGKGDEVWEAVQSSTFFLNGAGSREVSSTTQREEGRQEHQESSF